MANPKMITTPFANIGTKNDIPDVSASEPQLATMQTGFPSITQLPISAGGIPPERADFNGILNLYGQHIVHLNKGLSYEFDQAFANAIGGYPLYAEVMLTNGDVVKNGIDSNTNNPNTDMTGWFKPKTNADNVADDSGLNQQQINKAKKYVDLIANLKTIKASNGDVVGTNGHTVVGLGGGIYRFESPSTKLDNNGAWIASTASSGTWVLISNLTFENFGVLSNGLDQSVNMQACIDFADSQKILNYGFEQGNVYCLSNPIIFRAYKNSDISTFYSTELKLNITTNGAQLKPLAPITMIKIHRDHVNFDEVNAISTSLIGALVVQVGLGSDPEYPAEYRRSASFMTIGKLTGTNVRDGIKFCPTRSVGGSTYGMYYHRIDNVVYRNVTHGVILDLALDGGNQTTRSSIGSYRHNGGACSIVGLNTETFTVECFFAENLNADSTAYPSASKRAIYIPKIGAGMSLPNHIINITGSTEDVPYPIFCEATNSEINVYPAHLKNDQPPLVGYFNTGYGGTGAMPACDNLNTFAFPYLKSRMASVGVAPSTAGVASLPAGMIECYGNIQYLPVSSQLSTQGMQILTVRYPASSVYVRPTSGETTETTTFGTWVRLDKNTALLRHSQVANVNANTLTVPGERVTYGVSYGATEGATLNSPTGGEFYGTIEWIPANGSEGTQVAYGTYPSVEKRRSLSSTWTAWT